MCVCVSLSLSHTHTPPHPPDFLLTNLLTQFTEKEGKAAVKAQEKLTFVQVPAFVDCSLRPVYIPVKLVLETCQINLQVSQDYRLVNTSLESLSNLFWSGTVL